jgi:hypothetical protein
MRHDVAILVYQYLYLVQYVAHTYDTSFLEVLALFGVGTWYAYYCAVVIKNPNSFRYCPRIPTIYNMYTFMLSTGAIQYSRW